MAALYFAIKSKVNYYDCDQCDRLKLSGAMRYMQQASGEHLEFLGIPNRELLGKGIAFVLTKCNILIHRMPKAGEKIIIGTEPNRVRGVRFYREFRMDTNDDGEKLISAVTAWVLIDPQTRRILRPSAFTYEMPLVETIIDHEVVEEAVPESEYGEDGDPIAVDIRNSHIDVIGHVNNSHYADFACDALSRDELLSKELDMVTIAFRGEAKWGDQVVVTPKKLKSGEYLVSGRRGKLPCFDAYLRLK